MRLLFLPEEKLLALKGNILKNIDCYKKKDNSWIDNYFDGENPFKDSKVEVEDFELDLPKERSTSTDLDNVRILYSKLSVLSEAQAADERLWAGLCHGQFWEYMQYRWLVNNKNDVHNHYFFGYSKRRSLERNGLSRLWWLGWATHDSSREDPYELTRFVLRDTDFVVNLLGRNFSSNRLLTKAVLGCMVDYEKKNNINVNRGMFRSTMENINLIGGTSLLDLYNKDDYSGMVMEHFQHYLSTA